MISGVIKNFASVTIIRVFSRLLEFFLRVYLIREVLSPEILAEMVALDLILTTALHLTKCCLRPSYQQASSKSAQKNIISSMNLMSLGIIITFVSACIVIALQWHHHIRVQFVNQAMILYGVAAVLEAAKEKYGVGFVLGYQYATIAGIQFFSYLPKTLFMFVATKIGMFQQYGILVFAFGQVLYSTISLLITFAMTPHKTLLILPLPAQAQDNSSWQQKKPCCEKNSSPCYLDSKTKQIITQISYISILKLFLQQFQKIVLVINNETSDSSIYSLVSGLGSIIVRFVFAPLEQIAYNYYARGNQQESKKTLLSLVRLIGILGVTGLGFGWRYAENLLALLYGGKWVSRDSVFGFQCFVFQVVVVGFNGTIDAFVIARADPVHTIPKIKYYTILSTLVYFGSSLLLIHLGLGASSLFLGNGLGMATKILINWHICIKSHFSLHQFLKQTSPSLIYSITVIICMIISWSIKSRFSYLVDFVIGGVMFLVCLVPVVWEYRVEILGRLGKFGRFGRFGRLGKIIGKKEV